jgi:hypothetical protein
VTVRGKRAPCFSPRRTKPAFRAVAAFGVLRLIPDAESGGLACMGKWLVCYA